MKLSKAQQEVLNQAKKDIDLARKFDNHIDWLISRYGEHLAERMSKRPIWEKSWEEEKNGIVSTSCNSKTLKVLERNGLIEIIRDSNGERFGLDTIKVLNY